MCLPLNDLLNSGASNALLLRYGTMKRTTPMTIGAKAITLSQLYS